MDGSTAGILLTLAVEQIAQALPHLPCECLEPEAEDEAAGSAVAVRFMPKNARSVNAQEGMLERTLGRQQRMVTVVSGWETHGVLGGPQMPV